MKLLHAVLYLIAKARTGGKVFVMTSLGYYRISQLAKPGPIPVCASTIWRWVDEGKFPQPVKLSPRVTVWRVSDIEAWLKEKGGGQEAKKGGPK